MICSFQASYGRREIEIAEQEMPGIMALRKKASVSDMIWVKMVFSENHALDISCNVMSIKSYFKLLLILIG